eukprot:CAMPEP_0197437250 /NCGR_PEP_ID=MMETSP1175-20131217/4517_1 /TAXON_ID=1003142 /ORGANISM="Triceratium dubium, Strain CCMP147" /LENGTH=323 /DNA_ID=CAMNT_0042966717 /DNA_START=33 /DNA_END=1004 /DNA_ORIENTATION=+
MTALLRRVLQSACVLLVWTVAIRVKQSYAFGPTISMRPKKDGCLFMGKGFNSARNKQAELARKMGLAKKQRDPNDDDDPDAQGDGEESTQVKEDRAVFAELLAKSEPVVKKPAFGTPKIVSNKPSAASKGSKTKSKVKAADRKRRKNASSKGESEAEADRLPLREGDIAERRDFELLVSLETGKQLGPIGAAQLVPWVPPYLAEYLVVLVDPRRQSGDLRQSIQYLTSNLGPEVTDKVIVVSADPNDVTASWIKRSGIDTSIRMFSDEKLRWMQSYSAVVDDERWSMSIYLFCTSGVIRKLVRQVDPSKASQLVTDMVHLVEE